MNEGNYYEFEQKIILFGFRFSNQNLNQNAIALYFQASKLLLKHAQLNSGFNLASKIIELIPKGDIDHNTTSNPYIQLHTFIS